MWTALLLLSTSACSPRSGTEGRPSGSNSTTVADASAGDGPLTSSSTSADGGDAAAPEVEDAAQPDAPDGGLENEACAHPLQLTLPTSSVTEHFSGPGTNLSIACWPVALSGPDRAYRIEVTEPTGVIITARGGVGASWVSLRRACDRPETEIICGMDNHSATAAALEPGTYYAIVEAREEADLTVELTTYEPPEHRFCAQAMPLPLPSTLEEELFLADGGDRSPDCTGHAGQAKEAVLFYSASVPSGQRLVSQSFGFASIYGPFPYIVDACGPNARCIDELPRVPQSAVYTNHEAQEQQVIVAATAERPWVGRGPLELMTRTGTPSANVDCAHALPAVAGQLLNIDPMMGSFDPHPCDPLPSGSELRGTHYYTISVPPSSTFVAEGNPTVLFEGCPGTCVGSSAYTVPATWTNTTNSAQELGFAFGFLGSNTGEVLGLRVNVFSPPPNLDCASSLLLQDGDTLELLGPDLGVQYLGAVCLPESDWPPLYYDVTVPAGHTLTAVATPHRSDRIGLRLLDSCAPAACVAGAESYGIQVSEPIGCDGPGGCYYPPPYRIDSYDAATLTWVNTSSAARSFKLAAGINPNEYPSLYTLHVEIQPNP